MNSYDLQVTYYNVLMILAEMLRQYAAALGLLAPGCPEQLGLTNGVAVTPKGQQVYRAIVRRSDSSGKLPSIREVRTAVQKALDAVCYGADFGRLYVLSAGYLPGGYVGLVLTWGCW